MKKIHMLAALTLSILAISCGKLTVQVKKEAKNSNLQTAKPAPAETNKDNFSLANPEDFLKEIDGLRTTAADLIVKSLASEDYVGKFRNGVRKYRNFLLARAQKPMKLSDSFYDDKDRECRDTGLSLNMDSDNELLGMILKTAILAKVSETNVGKINSGLPKELQALSQFITMELGVNIQGESSMDIVDGKTITKGSITLGLKPIAGEAIDEATKAADAAQVLKLNFNRELGEDMIGSFHADISLGGADLVTLAEVKSAKATFDITRTLEKEVHVHNAIVSIGMSDEAPKYSRKITVAEIKGQAKQFAFTDTLNFGKVNESSIPTIIDLTKGTQCKIKEDVSPEEKPEVEKPVIEEETTTGEETTGGTVITTQVPPSPVQQPSQSPVQKPVKLGPK